MKIIFKFLFLILLITYSCSTNEIDKELNKTIPLKNKIDFKVNGAPPVNSIRGLTASFCCDSKISVSFEHWLSTSNGLGYGSLAFNLSLDKNGNLLGLWYKDHTHPNNEFYSPYFTPISTLSVENFQFIENQILKLKVSGQIFKKTYTLLAEPEAVHIEAEIEIKEFHKCICASFFSKLISNNNLIFHGVTKTQQGTDIRYFAYTNNGYQIEFANFNKSLGDMPLGIYYFDENSTSHRIDFRKFIGVPRVFVYSIIPQEWLKYDTSGYFEILERQQINGEIVTKVRFNLIAKHNNEVVFKFEDAILETQM